MPFRRVGAPLLLVIAACTAGEASDESGGALTTDGGAAAAARLVDPTTLDRKLLMGYQGWFACPNDGAQPNRWVHWFRGPPFDASTVTVDMWPSTRELDADELCPTSFTRPDGRPAPLYAGHRAKTIRRHFEWMKDHDLDGVLVQRFASELSDPAFRAMRDTVLVNAMAAAEATGRVFAVEYDVSGQNAATLVQTLKDDWKHLVDDLGVTRSPRYLRHRGKPLLEVWGFGFPDRPATPAQASEVIAWLRSGAPASQQVTLAGGVPREWRSDGRWVSVTRSFDVINPWTVGAFADDRGADAYAATLAADIADARANGRELLPVVFPGFSWKNLNAGPKNQIPRRGGEFYWRQVHNALDAGATAIFGAMFDEVDEGTAMYKLAPTRAELPAQGDFVSLDVDGIALPEDWYLRVANEAGKMLRRERPLTPRLPIAP